jgi:hypothetical protein
MLMLLEQVSMQKKKGIDIIPSSKEEQAFVRLPLNAPTPPA